MPCKCGHPIKDHDWNFNPDIKEPCHRCDCNNFKEANKRKSRKFIKRGIW